MSALIGVKNGGDQLSSEELLSTCVLVVAGHETTVNPIAHGVLALPRHPGQFAMLTANPGLAPDMVEGVLRYDPPVQLLMRVAGEDLSVGGTTVPSGSVVLLLLAAANRDPAVHEEPDRFDIAALSYVISPSGSAPTSAWDPPSPGWRHRSPSPRSPATSRRHGP